MDASKVLKKHAFLRIDILTVRLYRSLMADESLGIKVERKNGERFRRALVDLKAFDPGRKICSDGSQIYLPVRELSEKEAEKLRLVADYDVVNFGFVPEEKILTPEDILGFRPSFEIVGDIAMIEDLEEGEAERVASALMSSSNSIKTVIAPISDVEGEYRTRRYRHVAGEERTTTTHKEHGLRYRIDLEGAYFTPRLGTERLRIASLVGPTDVVLDMFAGVGPFSILMAKRCRWVVAMDKNPVAVQYLRENARLNKVENIDILEGDANEIALRYQNAADHVIMNLPHSASLFLPAAIGAAKPGGMVHYYCISPEDDLYRDEALIRKAAESL
ncbi:MAG TPA: class I SAM-dependent methyltransferase family protein, partial [Methanothrix soehngenii]|nr:class I SAM-dependent methyltransferase family protein [Methanothrix soehngenii]